MESIKNERETRMGTTYSLREIRCDDDSDDSDYDDPDSKASDSEDDQVNNENTGKGANS